MSCQGPKIHQKYQNTVSISTYQSQYLSVSVSISIYQYLSVSITVYQCLSVSISIKMYQDVSRCIKLYQAVSSCIKLYQAIQVIEFDRIRRFPICKNNTACHRRIDLAPEMPTPSSVAIRMVLPLPLLHIRGS